MKKSKGFTLIELLAVIVILAIIALIAVPIILNIIDKANKSAFKDSAYGIISAGELYFAEQQLELDGMLEDKEFSLPSQVNTEDGLQLKGEAPIGTVKINTDGKIALALTNDRYCITKAYGDTDIKVIEDYETCEIPVTTYVLGDPVFFNPVENRYCDEATEYSPVNSQTGVKTGCMRWYVYKMDEDSISLILDHNTTATVAWYADAADNSKGPITLMDQLKADTEEQGWKVEADIIDALDILNLLQWYQNLEDKDNWEEQYLIDIETAYNDVMTRIQANASNYETTLEMYKAMTEMLMTDYSDIALPRYLHEDLYSNCSTDGTCTTYGYWTKTAIASYSSRAWDVYYVGFMDHYSVRYDDNDGLRPVIELSK